MCAQLLKHKFWQKQDDQVFDLELIEDKNEVRLENARHLYGLERPNAQNTFCDWYTIVKSDRSWINSK